MGGTSSCLSSLAIFRRRNKPKRRCRKTSVFIGVWSKPRNLGIWIIDSENRTSFVNPKMAKLLRCSADEIVGKPIVSFMDAEGIALAEAQREAIRRGVEESQDYKLRRQDGAELWVRLSTSPLFDEQEQFTGTLAMVTECVGLKRRIESAEQWVGIR